MRTKLRNAQKSHTKIKDTVKHMDPADATSIVSIAGAMRITQRSVNSRTADVKELPHIHINGDYIRTSHIVNGYPVYVKINGQQWVLPPNMSGVSEAQYMETCCHNARNRFCIMMNVNRDTWCLKINANPDDPVCLSGISIPHGAASKQLEDLATQQTSQHKLELFGYPEATVSLKSMTDTMEAIAETATTHARRKGLVANHYECQTCADVKPFSDFIVLPCGHALLCSECHRSYVAHLSVGDRTRSSCTAGCSVPMSRYNQVTEHSDCAPLYMADPKADAEPSDAADTQPGAATRATANRFVVTVVTGCARIVAL